MSPGLHFYDCSADPYSIFHLLPLRFILGYIFEICVSYYIAEETVEFVRNFQMMLIFLST